MSDPKPPKIRKISVKIIDQAHACEAASSYRIQCRVSQAAVAKAINLTQGQLSFLENMERRWTEEVFNNYIAAVKELSNK
jgi:hypothetical protein